MVFLGRPALNSRYASTLVLAFLIITFLLLWHARSEPYNEETPVPSNFKPDLPKRAPIVDNFPILQKSHASIPPLQAYNKPPTTHVPEQTPLFIGFTRNWNILQQCVVSYIAAGWPPEDIYVVENTGTMNSNKRGLLSINNARYMNSTRLRDVLGVNVVSTPALLTFSQLQNFYLSYAQDKDWKAFYWSHMDVIVMSDETQSEGEHKSLYMRAVDEYRKVMSPEHLQSNKWATQRYSYDKLSLVNVAAFMDVGAWDPFISYYQTDCDMYERLYMENYTMPDVNIGPVWDMATWLEDVEVLFQNNGKAPVSTSYTALEFMPVEPDPKDAEKSEAEKAKAKPVKGVLRGEIPPAKSGLNDDTYQKLVAFMSRMTNEKTKGDRNVWQASAYGGQGEPFYYDPIGFEMAIRMTTENGKEVFKEKWGHWHCALLKKGRVSSDAWRILRYW